jgi:AhpD family alkylhydroperoxidase
VLTEVRRASRLCPSTTGDPHDRIDIHTIESSPAESREGSEALHDKFDTTLNIFGAMAASPTVLNTFSALDGAIAEHTSLDAKTREAVHLTVANVNACDYCPGAYTMAAKAAGFDDEQAKQIRRGAVSGDEHLTALLTLAREIAANEGHVEDTTWTPN